MSKEATEPPPCGVDLYWLPLGAGKGAHCVRLSGRLFEMLTAAREHRTRGDLYHSALEVVLDGKRFVVEMAPVWGNPWSDRGVVGEGAVALPHLGHTPLFRYAVRRWRDGVIPDVLDAVDSPRRLSESRAQAAALLELVPRFPRAVWGRDQLRAGEMWNSNSLVSWLLARSGHRTGGIGPPDGGRAPGWAAGLVIASREAAGVYPEA